MKASAEVEVLLAALDSQRAQFLKKLVGLSDADARRSTVPSGTNLAGLLQHLTFVESHWIEEILGGGKATRGLRSMSVDPGLSLGRLRSEYKAACDASNAIVRGVGDGNAKVMRNGRPLELRQAILVVIEETVRHTGHADIIREQIDGRTGR